MSRWIIFWWWMYCSPDKSSRNIRQIVDTSVYSLPESIRPRNVELEQYSIWIYKTWFSNGFLLTPELLSKISKKNFSFQLYIFIAFAKNVIFVFQGQILVIKLKIPFLFIDEASPSSAILSSFFPTLSFSKSSSSSKTILNSESLAAATDCDLTVLRCENNVWNFCLVLSSKKARNEAANNFQNKISYRDDYLRPAKAFRNPLEGLRHCCYYFLPHCSHKMKPMKKSYRWMSSIEHDWNSSILCFRGGL